MSTKELTNSITLAGWQATGLALAAAAMANRAGLGALVGAALLAPIVYALVRLRSHAPQAPSTAELVGSTLGLRAAAAAGILQVTGYALIAVTAAQAFGLMWVPLDVTDGLGGTVQVNPWLWSLWAVAAIVVAAVLVFALPGRVAASLAAVLALGGLLIQFYYGLAVVAHGLSDTAPEQAVGDGSTTGLAIAGMLATLAVTPAGFEVVTTRTRRGSSNGWPMGLAMAVVAVVALVVWWACQYVAAAAGSLDGSSLGIAVNGFYGDTGTKIVNIGAAMIVFGALLALLWGIGAVTEGLDVRVPADAVFGGIVLVMALLAVALIHGGWSPGYIGGLVLFALYAVVMAANGRIPGDSVVSWWLRLVMPVVFAAVVLLPLVWAEFDPSVVVPVVVAAVVIAAAVAAAAVGTRSRAD
ncbi:hypothetical protein CIW49_18095 [Mycolicibacterium sp. P1-18]|uniref:hypothetical protein n=1 Tax=Mycolicibacterium sp. P1-18 TaxID=2024615 RepID=UPI0011F312BA|nr:hypothetical protein [Mycolicibacterium sp. P1-18]KAA0097743.1 hypothetical protein CIW49_18095 [Mycolicibacterium sp. P1-18]